MRHEQERTPHTRKVADLTKERKPTFDAEHIRDLSEKVYRSLLEADCDGNVERMIAKDEDEGQKLRNRAGFYDRLTRTYLKVLGIEPDCSQSAQQGEKR